MTKKTFYDVLQVSPSADPEIIKAAYNSLIQRFHPDGSPRDPNDDFLKSLNQAFEILSDPAKRAGYDAALANTDEDQPKKPYEDSAKPPVTARTASNATDADKLLPYVTTVANGKNRATKWGLYVGWLIVWLILNSIVLVTIRKFSGSLVVGLTMAISCGLFIFGIQFINKRFAANQTKLPGTAYPAQPSDSGDMGLYEAIIGEKNTAYYLAKFDQFDQQAPGLKASWNWPAFFCTAAWALYRKMYGWFFAILGVSVILNVTEDAGAPVSRFVTLAAMAAFGVYANSLYHGKVKEEIAAAQLTVRDEPKLLAYLRQKGGVHLWVIWVFGLVCVIGILAAISLPAYQDYQKRAAAQPPATDLSGIVDPFDGGASPQSQQPTSKSNPFDDPNFGADLMPKSGGAFPQNQQPATSAFDNLIPAENKELMKRAEQGDVRAQSLLAGQYYYGEGVPKNYAQAALWFRKAAERGGAMAQAFLGFMYKNGQGLPHDHAQAVVWLSKAAEQGNSLGQAELGKMYLEGQSVSQDDNMAASLFHKAAEQGNEFAQTNLGFMYALGKGRPKDYVQAYMWFNLAASASEITTLDKKTTIEQRKDLELRMTPFQIEQAQALTRDWLAKHPR
ncbi:MAG: DnaJ domain-containing protein [Sulfuricella sp.]|nr:DnaJ domain-containing protein [Sulfuricella sp.]